MIAQTNIVIHRSAGRHHIVGIDTLNDDLALCIGILDTEQFDPTLRFAQTQIYRVLIPGSQLIEPGTEPSVLEMCE